MAETAEQVRAAAEPSEAAPERGRISAFGICLSEAEHWVEDGIHVIRSTEFDLVAGDPDFRRAVEMFGEKAEDLWWFLSELDTITDNENETFLVLAPRFMQVFKELERRESERRRQVISISFARFRSRGDHFRDWQPLSTPETFSQPSPV
jgi:hypothetical protein